jgi:hypothetical protein
MLYHHHECTSVMSRLFILRSSEFGGYSAIGDDMLDGNRNKVSTLLQDMALDPLSKGKHFTPAVWFAGAFLASQVIRSVVEFRSLQFAMPSSRQFLFKLSVDHKDAFLYRRRSVPIIRSINKYMAGCPSRVLYALHTLHPCISMLHHLYIYITHRKARV